MTACSGAGDLHCPGWRRINTPDEDKPKISRELAEQIVAHNEFGEETGCWEN